METSSVSLARQVDFVFRQLEGELTNATAGTVLIHVRNNAVGKFGVRHHPIECKDGQLETGEARFELADPGSPTLICDEDDRASLYVLMPRRV